MLVATDRRFFDAETQARLEEFVGARTLFGPELLELADRSVRPGRTRRRRRRPLPRPRHRSVRAVHRTGRPRLVLRAGADLGRRRGHRRGAVDPHQPPDAAGARHRRPLPADGGAGHHHDRRDPGTARLGGTRRPAAADLVQGAGRGAAVPVRRRQRPPRLAAGPVRGGRAARRRAHRPGARPLRPDGRRGRCPPRRGAGRHHPGRRGPRGVAGEPAEHRAGAGPAGTGVLHLPRWPTTPRPARAPC